MSAKYNNGEWVWLNLRVKPELKQAIEAAAEADERDISEWVRRALRHASRKFAPKRKAGKS